MKMKATANLNLNLNLNQSQEDPTENFKATDAAAEEHEARAVFKGSSGSTTNANQSGRGAARHMHATRI